MKIHPNSQSSIIKNFLYSNSFANIYYASLLIGRVFLMIIGVGLSISILLFVVELISPETVHFFNYSLSKKTFQELCESYHYHAAINLFEAKKELFDEASDTYILEQQLADCYVNTGDYPKALEQYRSLRQKTKSIINNNPDNLDSAQLQMCYDLFDICYLKEEFRIYLKMGDKANILKYSELLKTKYKSINWEELQASFRDASEELSSILNEFNLSDGFKFELIQAEYLLNPNKGIQKMEEYANTILQSNKFNHIYEIKLYNELIKMLLQQNDRIRARYYLEIALEIAEQIEFYTNAFALFGDLSEYCYQLNDIQNGQMYLQKYLYWIDDTYNKSDIDYALAYAKTLKYLENAGDWTTLTEQLDETLKTIRQQVSHNFAGMTMSQREFFLQQFLPIFTYTKSLLQRHPTERIAELVFENSIFLRGLLLRSEESMAIAIAAMNDRCIEETYHRYREASKELVARQYLSNIGNALVISQLEDEINQLEEELSLKCLEFRRNHKNLIDDITSLRNFLSADEIALQIVQCDNVYYALILDHTGNFNYLNIGNITPELNNRISLYTKPINTITNIVPLIKNKTIYYTCDGAFNYVSFASLPINENGSTIGDIAKIRFMASLKDICTVKTPNDNFHFASHNVVLWGGINYSTNSDNLVDNLIDLTRGIERGDLLRFLPASRAEVHEVAQLLQSNGINSMVFTASEASERTFYQRSGKKDYILHISTHGFFDDSGAFTNPMQNAGLLFAGSQPYWSEERIATTLNEYDGILRANEIATLDLSGCRLVVLSACQTGLGDTTSEGVYGLQRAFKLAGAESILMSLWNVDDYATKELILAFYNNLLISNNPNEALHEAQNLLRYKGYGPDKWAAFILLN